MDRRSSKPGQSSGSWVVDIPPGPLSPWLRLAHLTTYRGKAARDRGRLRRITDFMLLLQTEGEGWLWWEEADGSLRLPAGSVAFVPPGALHAHADLGVHYAVHFDVMAKPEVEGLAMLRPIGREVGPSPVEGDHVIRLRQPAPGGELAVPLITRLRAPALWQERFESLAFLYRTRGHRGLAASLHAAETIGWALRTLGTWHGATSASPDATERILAVIATVDGGGLARPWSIDALRRRAGMGRTAFWSAFQAVTGLAPHAYIEMRRVEQAKHRLLETRLPVADIAAEVGFADPFHFSRVFRRVAGRSPRVFRANGGVQ